MKVLVTGGAGFIGSHLVDALARQGHDVVALDNLSVGSEDKINPAAEFVRADIRDARSFEAAQLDGVEVVFHLAAMTHVADSITNPKLCFDVNVSGSMNALDFCAKAGAKMVFLSSAAVYGNKRGSVKETDACEPISPYGKHKLLVEEAVRKYGELRGVAYTIFRPFNIYGPGANSGVVGILADCAREGHPFMLYGPQHRRDFVFVDDVVRTLLMHERMGNATLNLGSGMQTSMLELVEAFRKAAKMRGKELKVEEAEDRPGEIDESCADTTELAKYADVKKFVRLEDGLSRCL